MNSGITSRNTCRPLDAPPGSIPTRCREGSPNATPPRVGRFRRNRRRAATLRGAADEAPRHRLPRDSAEVSPHHSRHPGHIPLSPRPSAQRPGTATLLSGKSSGRRHRPRANRRAVGLDTPTLERLRSNTSTGRPCERIEQTLDRILRPQKVGRKPRTPENAPDSSDLFMAVKS